MSDATRDQDGKALYRQGLRSVFAGWPPPFVDPRNPVPEVSCNHAGFGAIRLIPCRQILENRIPVDVGPFCDAVERLCGLHILTFRFMTGRHGTLHGITLPRSWLISLSRSLPLLDKNTSYIPHFVNDTIGLLRRIDNQELDQHGPRLGPLYTSAYIARL